MYNLAKTTAGLIGAIGLILTSSTLRTDAEQVYTLSSDGVIRSLQFGPCNDESCRWTDIDRNSKTISLAGGPTGLFQLHSNGQIWKWFGEPCFEGWCFSWKRLDKNSQTIAITSASGELYQLHRNGSIWRWKGRPCIQDRCYSWQMLDKNPRSKKIVAAAGHLYQLRDNGSIWEWQGQPCSASDCSSWVRLDRNPRTKAIVARGDDLFQLHDNGSIWRWKGQPCNGNSCYSWQMLDKNPHTRQISASRGGLYQLHDSGQIWEWRGAPCSRDGCSSWRRLDNNSRTIQIAAAGDALYQRHNNGTIWRWKGGPCSGNRCLSWERLDTGNAFAPFPRLLERDTRPRRLFAFDGMAFASTPIAKNQTKRLRPFGFEHRKALGSRRLLTILINSTRPFTVAAPRETPTNLLPKSAYEQIIYSRDSSTLSVLNFFRESSRGKFRFRKQGLIGPLTISGEGPKAFLTAADAEVDFSRFDDDHDGKITEKEVAILIVDNLTHGGGANRTPAAGTTEDPCPTFDGVIVCPQIAMVGSRSQFSNFTHEVSHLLIAPGSGDLYGSNNWLQLRGLMGHATVLTEPVVPPLAPQTVEFSPWNRMRFGWFKPELVSTTGPGGCTALSAPSYGNSDDRALLFYDPSRGSREYFMLEHRTNASGSDFYQHDNQFPGRGLAPWYVSFKTDPEGDIDKYRDASGNERQDRLVLMVADPRPRNQRRQPPLAPDGSFTALKWLNNGQTAANVSSRYASPRDDVFLQIEWNSGVPFPPSIYPAPPTGQNIITAQRGKVLILPQGSFGISANGRTFELRRGERRIQLSPTVWTCHEVRLSIPDSIPLGEYELFATHSRWTSSHPLNTKVRVREPVSGEGPF